MIKKTNEIGIAIETKHSASFPREYKIEIDGQIVNVIAMQWVLQQLVKEGQTVKIKGSIREQNGTEFISLEDYDDIIIASKNN